MNTKKFTIWLAFTSLLIFSVISKIFFNDFQNGWDAYVKKDYKTAYELWLPLADQGDSKAQFLLGFMHDLWFVDAEDDEELLSVGEAQISARCLRPEPARAVPASSFEFSMSQAASLHVPLGTSPDRAMLPARRWPRSPRRSPGTCQ